MQSLAESYSFWIGLIAIVALVYILPTLIAVLRRVESLGLVVVFNVIAVGWPAALILAVALPRRQRA